MSDLENKLRKLALRDLPADLRRQVLSAAAPDVPRWTWRDWFWPSPVAWGALSAVLLGAAAFDASNSGGGAVQGQLADRKEARQPVMVAFRARVESLSDLIP